MAVISRHRCEVNAQNMAEWGGPMWGGGQQLFCRAQPGGFVTLAFSNSRRGGYRLRVLATAAPDYGVVRVALDGKHLGPKIKINICFATTDPTTQSLNRTWDWPDFAKAKPTSLSRARRADFDSLRPPRIRHFPRIRCNRDKQHPVGSLFPKTRAPARTSDPEGRILRIVSRLLRQSGRSAIGDSRQTRHDPQGRSPQGQTGGPMNVEKCQNEPKISKV